MPKKLAAALQAAFPHTIPVLTGFVFLGIAYGILMSGQGYGWPWILLMSGALYAGSLQFVGVSLLAGAFNPLYALTLALVINARHLFYGVSMLEKYSGTGKLKPYLIFGLCDETFSVLCSVEPPPQVEPPLFMLAVTLLHQCYWIAGGLIGGLVGPLLTFNTRGIDFVMTAFFVVIFIKQWGARKNRLPALCGLGAAALSLLVCGAENFIIPAMILIIACLSLLRKRLAKEVEE
jgi:4-azaleucine resistance transporter AzlC